MTNANASTVSHVNPQRGCCVVNKHSTVSPPSLLSTNRFTATVVITEMAACRIRLSEEGRRTPVCNSLVLMCFSEKHFVVYLFY